MDYAELLQQVQVAGALDRATAEGVMLATVVTLADAPPGAGTAGRPAAC